ncbi:hypothetical protein MD484_g6023, partial [Candolleomyces efflorescens]
MDPGTSSLKRKRENEYPRVTFNAGPRTFDRLLKEKSLDELKDGVRKKLGYPSQVPLHLAQLRAGMSVDLEDEDDFEAFCSAAYSSSVITVQVIEPEEFTPTKLTPVPPTGNAPPGSPKKRKKKRKLADDITATHDETEPTPALKRKAPPLDSDPGAPSKGPEPVPPKKKKKRDVPPGLPNASAPTEDGVAPKFTTVDKSAGEKVAEKDKAVEKEKLTEKEQETAAKKAKSTEKEQETAAEKGKGKATGKKKKEKAAETTTKKVGQSKDESTAQAEPTGGATRSDNKPKKKKAAEDKALGDKSAPQVEGGDLPEPDAGAAGPKVKGSKGKETSKNKKAGRTGNDVSDKTPAAEPVDDDEDSDHEDESNSSKGKKKTPAKAPVVIGEQAGVAKTTAGENAATLNAQNQTEPSIAGPGGAAKKPIDPKAPSNKPSDTTVCPICARAPAHTQSRCSIYRASLMANLSFLDKLKNKQAEDPTNEFRARQIHLVEGLVTKKQNKSAQNGKVVSDIVVGVANLSTKSAKSARVTQSQSSAPKGSTVLPSSNPSNENPGSARTSKPSASAQSSTAEISLDEPVAAKAKPPIPNLQQSKKDQKANAKGFTPAQRASASNSSSPPDEESPEETSKEAVPPPPAPQTLAVPVESDSSRDEPPERTSVPRAKSRAKQDSSSPSSSDDSSDDEPPSRLPPPPGSNVSASFPSLTDAELDAVIRGPRISITSKNLPLSSSSSDEDEDKGSEDLVQDSEEEKGRRRRRSNAFEAAQLSSDEEDSDGGDQSEKDQPSHDRQPPQLSVDVRLQADESSPSTAVEHGNLSFGAANDLASSVEIDSCGDRAFSEAFADDTAVFKLAAAEPEDSNSSDESDGSDHRPATPKVNKSQPKSTVNDRHDSIEPFESPEKPKSPIIQQDLLQSTPRGLAQRMKGRRGRAPTPASSMQKAFKLLDSATKLVNASSRTATVKPTQSQRPGPVTSTPANAPRTTRSKANAQSQASDITLHVEETPLGTSNWEVLQESANMEDELQSESVNMEDELQSDPLFIPGETQNSFPYSQWQQPPATSPNDSEDEDEVENTIITARPPTASQKPNFGYTGLSDIASQRRSFRTSLIAAPSRPTDKKKDMVEELYGQAGEEPSDDSDSGSDADSDSDAEKPVKTSHIPKSRRAGVRSKA